MLWQPSNITRGESLRGSMVPACASFGTVDQHKANRGRWRS